MAIITGNQADFSATVGRLAGGSFGTTDSGDLADVHLTAVADGTATSPCFSATIPAVAGYPARLSVQPVTGYAPTTAFVLTVADTHGSSWTYSVTTTGSANVLGGTALDVPLVGALTISIDDMGARARVQIALILTNAVIAPVDLAQPTTFTVGDATDQVVIDPANGQITTAGAANPIAVDTLNANLWRPPEATEYTGGLVEPTDKAGATFTANRLWAVPVLLPQSASYQGMRIHVDTAGATGARCRLGVYADDPAAPGNPGALIAAGAAEINCESTGFKTVAFASDVLLHGYYWRVLINNDATIVFERTTGDGTMPLNIVESGTRSQAAVLVYRSLTYGALPDPFGTAVRGNVSHPPRMQLQRAS